MSQIQGSSGSVVDPGSTGVPNGAPGSDPEGSYGGVSTSQLRAMAQGCTEFSCIYHGAINMELRQREQAALSAAGNPAIPSRPSPYDWPIDALESVLEAIEEEL